MLQEQNQAQACSSVVMCARKSLREGTTLEDTKRHMTKLRPRGLRAVTAVNSLLDLMF